MFKPKLLVILLLYVAIKSLFIEFAGSLQNGKTILDFIDVGQGDSIFITTPLGRTILIDGGPNYDSDAFLDDRIPFWDCYIDYVIITHPDADHLTGVNRILKRCKAGLLVFPGIPVESLDSDLYKGFINSNALRDNKISNKSFDKVIDGVEFHFLMSSEFMNLNPKNTNDHSVFVCMDYGGFDALFTEEVKPVVAVISVGKNKFGHPDPQVIENYAKNGTEVFRTDELGNISIVINKNKSFKLK